MGASRTGPAYVTYNGQTWYFYVGVSSGDKYRLNYKIAVEGNNPHVELEWAIKVEPRAIVHPDNGMLYVFFASDHDHVNGYQIVPDGQGGHHHRYFKLGYLYDHDRHHGRPRSRPNFGVSLMPGGFLVTHRCENEKRLYASYYSLTDLGPVPLATDADDVTWDAMRSVALPFTTDDCPKLDNVNATVIADAKAESGFRLVICLREDGERLVFLEAALSPELECGETSRFVLNIESGKIESDRIGLCTGPDGRACASFYRNDRPYLLTRNAFNDWRANPINSLSEDSVGKKINQDTVPTLFFYVKDDGSQADSGGEQTAARVPVYRRVCMCDDGGNFRHGNSPPSGPYGEAVREPLERVTLDAGLPVLGIIEGGPPMPTQNLTIQDYNVTKQMSTVKIVDSTSNSAETRATGKVGFIVATEGDVRVGLEDVGISAILQGSVTGTVGVTGSRTFASGYSWGYTSLTRQTTTTKIEHTTRPVQRPDDGTVWPDPTGTVIVLGLSAIGYKYYFVPYDCDERSLPGSIPLIYEYTPDGMEMVPMPYMINPNDVVPGVLDSYKNPYRAQQIASMARLELANEAGTPLSSPVSLGFASSGGSTSTEKAWFTSNDTSSGIYADLTDKVGISWDLKAILGGSRGSVVAGIEYAYTETQTESTTTENILAAEMTLNGDPGNPTQYDWFQSSIYFLQPDPNITREWRDRLIWDGMSDKARAMNQKLVDRIDPSSNAWKICYIVTNSEPASLSGPYDPARSKKVALL